MIIYNKYILNTKCIDLDFLNFFKTNYFFIVLINTSNNVLFNTYIYIC